MRDFRALNEDKLQARMKLQAEKMEKDYGCDLGVLSL